MNINLDCHEFSLVANAIATRKNFIKNDLIPIMKNGLKKEKKISEKLPNNYANLLKDYTKEYEELDNLYKKLWEELFHEQTGNKNKVH